MRVVSSITFASLLLSGVALISGAAQAASLVAMPGSVESGRFEQRYRIDTRPAVERAAVVQEEDDHTAVVDEAGANKFELKAVRVTHATVFSSDELQAMFQDNVGKQVSLNELRAIASEVTQKYRNAGYILSKAVIPPQRIGEGVVIIEMIEGSVDNVVFQGAERQNQALLAAYAEKIKNAKPLTNEVLERYLLLMDDLTGVTARGVLSPSATNKGQSTLTVNLDAKAVEGQLSLDNRGSKYLGPWEAGVMVASNSALGLSEQIRLRAMSSTDFEELHYYEGAYQQPVGTEGTILRVLGSYTETQPGSSLELFDVEGDSVAFMADVQHPLKRTRQENIYVGGGLRYRDASTDTLGVNLYEDNIRSIYANIAYDTVDGLDAINRVDTELTQGLGVFGANGKNDPVSRANGENVFTKLNIDYSRLQPLSDRFSWYVGAAGQVSADALLASEEFTVGGMDFGSAYDSAEISGDHGLSARTELRFSDVLPESWGSVYQLYVFYDGGKVYNKDVLVSEQKSESIVSAGLGTRLNLAHDLYATAEIAKPLTKDVAAKGSDGDEVRGFMSVVYGF